MSDFYGQLAPFYHLIYEDWEASIALEADFLSDIIRTEWGTMAKSVLDASCGIGKQSFGLAARGFQVTASDLSSEMVARAKKEAQARHLDISFSVCDMRALKSHHGSGFDVVICAGNSIPHLLSDSEILLALKEIYDCLRPGGGCILTIRKYDQEARGKGIFKPFGVREEDNKRYVIFQIWDFEGEQYALSMYIIEENKGSDAVETHIMHSRYYAISPDHLLELVRKAGFDKVKRLNYHYRQYHPAILVGSKKA